MSCRIPKKNLITSLSGLDLKKFIKYHMNYDYDLMVQCNMNENVCPLMSHKL
jgi:hypothetical protein